MIDTVPTPEHPPFSTSQSDRDVDPVPMWYLLEKPKLAQLMINKIDLAITGLEKQIDYFKLQRDLLKKEYDLK
ncbi:hypothetical protein KA005_42965 [bacterium]|nr:hypothetical protein [bacterium]